MNGYTLTRNWYNYKFEHPSKVRHVHSDLYFYIIDLWNRLGQKKEFGLPTMITMESVGIGSYNTYKKTLNDLIDFGFIKLIQESKNQHISKIISISALSKNDKATDKALDKAHTKADDKATDKATDSIIEQENKGTKEQLNKEQFKEGKPSTLSEKIDYGSFVNFYNGTCTNLPKVIKITQSRKSAIKTILKKFEKKEIATALKIANETDFLIGKNKRGWKADFDFLIKEKNLTKIIEGSYEKNIGNNSKGATGEELRAIVEAHFRT